MRWQDIHFNHLSKTLSGFTIDVLVRNIGSGNNFKAYCYNNPRTHSGMQSTRDPFQEYLFAKKALNEMCNGRDIIAKFNSLFLFNAYFFDNEATNDLMYGLLSRLDFKVKAPLLAAVKEIQGV